MVDDYSRECILQIVDFSISGKRLARELNQLAKYRKLPNQIICDNGPEFTSKAMFFLATANWRKTRLYSTRQTNSECVYRKLEWEVQKRVFKSILVSKY